jgi:cation diffusion facilitator family transporter
MDADKSAVKAIRRITWIGIAGNVAIAILKFALGIIGSSQALVADAVHSVSDLVTDFAILIGVRFWSTPPDESHPYGHGRIEAMVTVGIGLAIAVVALGIAYHGLETIVSGNYHQPAFIAVAGAMASILVKEILFQWTAHVGRKARSSALLANAWHHRSDALSSIPVALAVAAAAWRPEWAMVDAFGAVVVGGIVLFVAWKILAPALMELSDGSASPQMCREIEALALEVPEIRGVHRVRTRHLGSLIHVDLHAVVDGQVTLTVAHDASEALRQHIKDKIPEVVDVLVHVDPDPPQSDSGPPDPGPQTPGN